MTTVLHHALCGDDFHQTPVSNHISGNCSKFCVCFVGDATQVYLHTISQFAQLQGNNELPEGTVSFSSFVHLVTFWRVGTFEFAVGGKR